MFVAEAASHPVGRRAAQGRLSENHIWSQLLIPCLKSPMLSLPGIVLEERKWKKSAPENPSAQPQTKAQVLQGLAGCGLLVKSWGCSTRNYQSSLQALCHFAQAGAPPVLH